MGRALRLTYAGALHHVTVRCNNKEFLFDEASFRMFRDLLRETAERFEVRLFNYCLMTNHVHLLFDVPADDVLPAFMHRQENVFARRFNLARDRKGHLWEGRYRSTIVEAPSCFLRCMAYLDLNPVRAGMVQKPRDYPWSAHRELAAEDESTIRLHEVYLRLGPDRAARCRAYMQLLSQEAERPARSLATVLFVGTGDFVSRMRARFGLRGGAMPRVESHDFGDGAKALELSRSRKPAESTARS